MRPRPTRHHTDHTQSHLIPPILRGTCSGALPSHIMQKQNAPQEIGSQCPCSSTAQQDQLAGQRSVIRLSWPRESDKRRAIVSKTPVLSGIRDARSSPDANVSDARFVHVSYWDVEQHDRLTKKGRGSNGPRLLHIPWTPWNPSKLQDPDRDLLEYCTL